MGKHSKNNNDRAFFSHAERKAAAYGRHSSGLLGGHNTGGGNFVEWGWGSETRTLDSDSMKDIDACALSLQPCVAPLVTPDGVVYDKEVVLEYILSRKKEIERATQAWEAQQALEASGAAADAAEADDVRIAEFVARQEGLSKSDLQARAEAARGAVTHTGAGSSGAATRVFLGGATSQTRTGVHDNGVHTADSNFWVVGNTPEEKRKLAKPDAVVRCPVTNSPLRLKTMIAARFTQADESASTSDLVATKARERYICPLSKKALSNVTPATVLRPSGMVIASVCVKDFIRKDMIDPFTDPPVRLKEKDIVPLRVEGTGYAARTDEKQLKVTKEMLGGGGGF